MLHTRTSVMPHTVRAVLWLYLMDAETSHSILLVAVEVVLMVLTITEVAEAAEAVTLTVPER